MSHWKNTPDDHAELFGFIYRITNLLTTRQYIGKKQFFSIRRTTPKGKTRRITTKKESDWRTYTGSSVHLNADIAEFGIHNFRFEILSLHKTKGDLHYEEVRRQVMEDVLRLRFDDGSRKFYNGQINAVKFIPKCES